jgi:pyruvate/2-oxoglutarate dehydrogenase complex dihydrolipoamide acyltransferase (E2) component
MTHKILAPLLNPNDPVARLTRWYVETGRKIKPGDAVCDITTSKVTFTIDAEAEGYIGALRPLKSLIRAGESVAYLFSSEAEALAATAKASTKKNGPVFSRKAVERLRHSNLSEEAFSDLEFVSEKEVLRRMTGGEVEDGKQFEIAALQSAYRDALRSSVTARFKPSSKISPAFDQPFYQQAFFAYHTCQALKEDTRFLLTRARSAIKDIDIGYAIDNGDGPVQFLAKRAEAWELEEWRSRITSWSLAAMRGEVDPRQLGAGAFSITDLSASGVWSFEPLLVREQSAILAVGGDQESGEREFTLTLAFDHRVHNGRQAGEFLARLKRLAHQTT